MTGITTAHRKRAAQILRRLKPPEPLYAKYVRRVDKFIRHFQQSKSQIPRGASKIRRLEMITSEYFGKRYLVAFVDRQWLSQIAPACDAVASAALTHLGLTSPPIVILPEKSNPRKPGFSSIFEHEIVHVNQGIVGKLPNLGSCKLENGRLFEELIQYTLMEYEANFVQLVQDPTLLPPARYGFGLEEWCHLRGFTSGIEIILKRMMIARYPEAKMMKFVRKLEADLPFSFKSVGLSARIGKDFAKDLDRMLSIAAHNVDRKVRGSE